MSQKKTPKKASKSKDKKPVTELTDDQAIRKLFPKEAIERINDEIGHKPKKPT
jgi:hypothetical protein